MIIGILKETGDETRVSILPEIASGLIKSGNTVWVESGAGLQASKKDEDYVQIGAAIKSRAEVFSGAEMIIKINAPEEQEMNDLKEGQVFFSAFQPLFNKEIVSKLAEKKVTSFSMDFVPRITRAQSMDVLSSMSTVSGYKAVLEAAMNLPRFFPMFMTAAGTIRPAQILILGAGVAGLQAIATAKRLGAVVYAFDTRPSVKEQVMSLGGKFVEVEGAVEDKAAGGYAVEQSEEFKKKQSDKVAEMVAKSDVVITTALIPGRTAPILITKQMVETMKPGSVIIDIAAVQGGNCELTENNKTVVHNMIKIIGNSFYPATMPEDASRMYSKNMESFLKLVLDKEGKFNLNLEDEVIKGTVITHAGEVINERLK